MTRLTADIYGYDPNNGDATTPPRKVEVEVGEQMLRVSMQEPGLTEALWPDLMIEWRPGIGWCVYVHPNNGEVAAKIVIDSAKFTRVLTAPHLTTKGKLP